MELIQAIVDRRSVRRFTVDPVTEQEIKVILEAARWAPSWANTQCCHYVVVRDAGIKQKLAATLIGNNPASDGVRTAPVVLAVCVEQGKSGYKRGQAMTDWGDWCLFDAGLAVQNLSLAIHGAGLGSVIVGMMDTKKAGEVLQLPQNTRVLVLLPLGHPSEIPKAPARRELADLMSCDCYGQKAPAT